jgi:iron complex outermembrane receptor protein
VRVLSQSLWVAGSVGAVLGACRLSVAQEAAEAGGLQEIVVTAQRQEQSVLSVSDSVQAISMQELQNAGITDLTDLQFQVPGYLPSTGSGYTQIFLRGVGNSIFVGADPSVATYIDDVPRIYGSMVDQLVDVERVEVLKGAQGGLYGRNATGGVINIATRQPDTTLLKGNVLLDYGEYNTLRAAGYVNLPLTNSIALSVAAERDSHDPFIRNISTDSSPYTAAMFPAGSALGSGAQTAAILNSGLRPSNGYDDQSLTATDAKLLFKPAESFKLTLSGDYTQKTGTAGGQLVQTNPANNQATLTGLLTAFLGVTPELPANFLKCCDGKFTTSMGLPTIVDLLDDGGSAAAVWNAPGVDLTSISAYRYQQTEFYTDLGADTVPVEAVDVRISRHFVYQELRAVSTFAGPFHLLGGATFLRSSFTGNTIAFVLPPLLTTPLTHENTIVKDYSVYGQIGYDLTSELSLTASGRYIHEINNTNFTQPLTSAAGTTESKFLPSATLSYKLDDGNVYVRWARGFKAGGVNPVASPSLFPLSSEGSVFGPEQVDTYEVGYRQGLLNHKMQLTTAAFYNDYKGLQVSDHARPQYESEITLAIVNVGSARTWGFEETLETKVAPPLTVGLNAGYLNAKYKQFSLFNNPVLADLDLNNTRMTNAPAVQAGLTASLDQPITDRLHLFGYGLESYISRVLYQASANPGVLPNAEGSPYFLTNLRMGLKTADDRFSVAVFVNNLFNREYITQGTSVAATGNQLVEGDPRVVGGEIIARF